MLNCIKHHPRVITYQNKKTKKKNPDHLLIYMKFGTVMNPVRKPSHTNIQLILFKL